MLLRQKHFLPREPAEQQFLLKSSRAFARGLLPSYELAKHYSVEEERLLARGRGDGDPFAQLQRRMNSVFEDFFGRSSSDLDLLPDISRAPRLN
jgi:hypothetical protein